MFTVHAHTTTTTAYLTGTDDERDARSLTMTATLVYLNASGEVRTVSVEGDTPRVLNGHVEWESEVIGQYGGTVVHIIYGERDDWTEDAVGWVRM